MNVHQNMNKYSLTKWLLVTGWLSRCDDDLTPTPSCLTVHMSMCNDDLTPTPPCLTVHMSMCNDDPSSTPCKDCIKLSICMTRLCEKSLRPNDRILRTANNIAMVRVEYFPTWTIIISLSQQTAPCIFENSWTINDKFYSCHSIFGQ